MKFLVSGYTDHQHRKTQILICCPSLTLNRAVDVKVGLHVSETSLNLRYQRPTLPCNAKRQDLLTLQVSRYCLLDLQCSTRISHSDDRPSLQDLRATQVQHKGIPHCHSMNSLYRTGAFLSQSSRFLLN